MAITRCEAIAAVSGAVTTVQSATWKRRTDKKVNRCPNCDTQVARHAGAWICSKHGEVTPYQSLEARKGDIVTMQFIPKINPKGTKNWTPNGGQCFGVATREQADAIKRRRGLVGVLKMSEKKTSDLRGEPRTIPVFDLETLTFEGQTHAIVG